MAFCICSLVPERLCCSRKSNRFSQPQQLNTPHTRHRPTYLTALRPDNNILTINIIILLHQPHSHICDCRAPSYPSNTFHISTTNQPTQPHTIEITSLYSAVLADDLQWSISSSLSSSLLRPMRIPWLCATTCAIKLIMVWIECFILCHLDGRNNMRWSRWWWGVFRFHIYGLFCWCCAIVYWNVWLKRNHFIMPFFC